MHISDTDSFALAVVQSSDPAHSVEEKIKLYIEAKKKAQEHNDKTPLPDSTFTGF